jgi:tryptophanase
MHFDTFRGNAEVLGALVEDLVFDEGKDAASPASPFKGNMDIAKCEKLIAEKGVDQISVIILTVTCNNNGGQPVSMQNIKDVAALAKKLNIPFVMDIARIAENAYFIKTREEGYQDKDIVDIVKEQLSFCESAVMSAKKDGLVNIGGLFLTRNQDIFAQANQLAIVHEGFITYGGLAGRDMDALAVGIKEACDFDYLQYRVGQVEYLGNQLKEKGIPIIEPPRWTWHLRGCQKILPPYSLNMIFQHSDWWSLCIRNPASVPSNLALALSVGKIRLPVRQRGLNWKRCASRFHDAFTPMIIWIVS